MVFFPLELKVYQKEVWFTLLCCFPISQSTAWYIVGAQKVLLIFESQAMVLVGRGGNHSCYGNSTILPGLNSSQFTHSCLTLWFSVRPQVSQIRSRLGSASNTQHWISSITDSSNVDGHYLVICLPPWFISSERVGIWPQVDCSISKVRQLSQGPWLT